MTTSYRLKQISDFVRHVPKGVIVEVGLFKGSFLSGIAKAYPGREIYGYDTFEGLPEPCELDKGCHKKAIIVVHLKKFNLL